MINEKRARKYCKEDISKIKNYDLAIADTTQTWVCHHMTETWWNCSKQDLIDNECYYNRKACELIFLTPAEHRRLHNMKMLEETRRKISEANKGRTSPMKGRTLSDETRKKMSESLKGRTFSEETRRKMSESHKGKSSPRKGVILSEETRKKMSESHKRRSVMKKNLSMRGNKK